MASRDRAASWVRFAQEDLLMAGFAFEAEIWNQACFHSQQAAEKFLKAFLEASGARVPELHSLIELRALCEAEEGTFASLNEACLLLDRFYIPTRYPSAVVGSLPDGLPNRDDAAEAVATARAVQQLVTRELGKRP